MLLYLILGGVLCVLALLKLRFWLSRTPVCHGRKVAPFMKNILQDSEQIQYDLKDVVVPVLFGWKFSLVTWLSYTRIGRLLLVPWLLRSAGVDRMRSYYIPEKPTYYPNPAKPPMTRDNSRANIAKIAELVEREISDGHTEDFHFPSVADFVRAYRCGNVTPSDVAMTVLEAIANSDRATPPLRAIVQSNRDVVLAMAAASTQRWKDNKTLSPLDGVPVAVKEGFRVEPYPFRSGGDFVPKMSIGIPESVAVDNLKRAGAVIIGMANLQEFGTGTLGSNPNKSHSTARNPYNTQCYPGGSSSGSAVSVAAGFCPIAIGTDGGDSVRIPAVLCGVVGLKPTYGLIDTTGMLPLSYSVGVPGPLCSSVLDAALAMDIMSKGEDGNRLSLDGLGEERLDGLNIGVYWDYFQHADSEIVTQCKAAVSKLESLGATIVSIAIPELEESRVAHSVSIISEFSTSLLVDTDAHFNDMCNETLMVLTAGYQMPVVNFLNAQKQRSRAIAVLQHLFDDKKLDAIVSPGTACVAPAILPQALSHGSSDLQHSTQLMRFAYLANLTGVPGLVVPVGYTSGEGLPIGLQLMGGWYQENTLLKIGWALEKGFPRNKPQVFYDILKKKN
ncbi:uncharacterized protein LOC135342638 [Halichondria panicea]|uniref:uncharacterized protein LOC135342638 n=1 Tax=Halichondria panicea TaxID=6063 RepID=UPI00312B6148